MPYKLATNYASTPIFPHSIALTKPLKYLTATEILRFPARNHIPTQRCSMP
ncbi:hypothetical protein NTGBS_890018 [Candidatus Nitrotoga sp. BS]|nr:hypothetical protein NTGBS_890018 [Candidatus Nitrotoga sp. BS]